MSNSANRTSIIVAIIGALALIVAAFIGLFGPLLVQEHNEQFQAQQTATAMMNTIATNVAHIPTITPIQSTSTATITPSVTDTLVPPTPTSTETEMPTEEFTSSPSASATSIPPSPTSIIILSTATPFIVFSATPGFPCDAQVDPSSPATTLNVVRQFPNLAAKPDDSVNRGDTVRILSRSEGTDVFYQIQVNNQTRGWISAQYLILSNQCPK